MEVNPEAFFFPKEDEFVAFVPSTGVIMQVSGAIVSNLQALDRGRKYNFTESDLEKLLEFGIIGEEFPERKTPELVIEEYKPSSLMLLPSWDCNLACTYCYAEAGDRKGVMSQEIALKAIDFVVANALDKGAPRLGLTFHGGGEPFAKQNMGLVSTATDYFVRQAQENGLETRISAVTNAVMGASTRSWVIKNLDSVSVSWDGTPDIQDVQRPNRRGGPTSQAVLNTVRAFDDAGFPYGIRSTVTRLSVSRLPEIVQYFASHSKARSIHLEPAFETGRGLATEGIAPNLDEFVNSFIEARRVGDELGVNVNTSGADLRRSSTVFCGAAGRNFFVTPEGNITTCLEVAHPEDNLKSVFVIGAYNPESGTFVIDEDKRSKLLQRTVYNMDGCTDCYAQLACAGDCLAKVMKTAGDLMGAGLAANYRCNMNRRLIKDEIFRIIDKGVNNG